jgi:hypothetical protein
MAAEWLESFVSCVSNVRAILYPNISCIFVVFISSKKHFHGGANGCILH